MEPNLLCASEISNTHIYHLVFSTAHKITNGNCVPKTGFNASFQDF